MKLISLALTTLIAASATAKTEIGCAGHIIDKAGVDRYSNFVMAEEDAQFPGHLLFERTVDGVKFKADARYSPSDDSGEIRLQVQIGDKASINVDRLEKKDDLANLMLMNDVNALDANNVGADTRFIDLFCSRK